MKSPSECQHDARVRQLERELTKDGAICHTFVQYQDGKNAGEIDLLAIYDTLPPVYEFYEVKCHNIGPRRRKAKEQYRRFLRTYGINEMLVKGYMTTCTGGFLRL